MNREDARRKVRALRATAAPGSGAFPAERETAARLADKLERENGLNQPKPFTAQHFAFGTGGAGFTVEINQFMKQQEEMMKAYEAAMLRAMGL